MSHFSHRKLLLIRFETFYKNIQRFPKFRWSESHLSIVYNYYVNLHETCDFGEVGSSIWGITSPTELASFAQELKNFFKVPRLKKFHGSQNRVKKYQLVEVFISFLLQLLYHKTDPIVNLYCIADLEKKLRFLLTILGGASLMLCGDEHEEFQKLLADFEAVANEAARLVHSLFFSIHQASGKMDERIGVVLNHIDLLEADTNKFLNLLPFLPRASVTPKTSVVDSLLILDSLIHDLDDLMNREDNPNIDDVKDQLKRLQQGLIFLQSSIKYLGLPQPSEIGELKEPLMQIGDLAHEAEYLILSFSVGDAPLWYLINRLSHIDHKIELFAIELQEITKEYKFGGLKRPKYYGAQRLSFQDQRNTEVNDVIVGLEDSVMNILDQLIGGTDHLQVTSIIGMAGIGKTTLAKKLYNHPSVNYHFDKSAWSVVSQTYQNHSVLANILVQIESELGRDRISKMEEERLVEHIYKNLKGRRYLIVIDDIWSSNVWDDLRRCFPNDGNGSRILLTSRNKDVAPLNSITYPMNFLSEGQCWELFKKKVFDDELFPPELLGVGKKIAANCGALPLAVVVVAGVLSTMNRERRKWEEVEENLASYIFEGGDNSVMQILELSYEHLPQNLKPCFLYFGAFRGDKEIPVGKLMRLWIAEGFIHKEEGKTVESIAEEYLMELINRNLVTVAKRRSDGGVKACAIHDLLRDLCLKKCEEENFLKFVKNDCYSVYGKGHRLQELEEHCVNSICCQHVRSLHGRRYLTSPFYVRDMRLMRVIHFDFVRADYIGIEYLVNLRYLVLSDLPASIGSLVNLEYVCVKTSKRVVYLPAAIMKMKKLRYVHVGSTAIYDKDCNSSQTNNLEFLSGVLIRNLGDEEMLKCSPRLRRLKLSRERLAPRHVDLSFLTQLESLNIRFWGLECMEKISLPSNIRKLTLSGMTIPWEKMSIIGRLENLEVLKLRCCAFEDQRWDTKDDEFEKLTFLELNATDLSQWNVDSRQHFSRLQRLVLINCRNLEEIPCEIGEISTLQMIEVKGRCPKSLAESAKSIQQQQWEMGIEELRVVIITTDT